MRTHIFQGLVAVLLAASLLMTPIGVVQAANTQLSGQGVQVGSCGGRSSDFTIEMSGSLQGCWYTTILDSTLTPSGTYHESGTEVFVGCLRDGSRIRCGTFDTTYNFNGKFDENFAEIFGRCEHKIVSGTGPFSGGGRIDFKDDVANTIFDYRGHIAVP